MKKAGPNFSGSLVLLFRGNEVVDDSRTESLPLKLTLCLLKVLYAPYKIQRSGHTPITTSVLPENQLWPGNCWVLLLSPTYCCFSYPWSCLPVLWGSGFTRQLGARSKGPGWRSIIHNAHAWEGGETTSHYHLQNNPNVIKRKILYQHLTFCNLFFHLLTLPFTDL